jgi:hypothetical protein
MKFWQLTSIFRDEKEILEVEFNKPQWLEYLKNYENLEFLVKRQQRNILDMQIPFLLLKNICLKSKKKIYGSSNDDTIYNYKNDSTNREYTIADAVDIFDHNAIEEVFEKSSSIAKTKST